MTLPPYLEWEIKKIRYGVLMAIFWFMSFLIGLYNLINPGYDRTQPLIYFVVLAAIVCTVLWLWEIKKEREDQNKENYEYKEETDQ